jgi:hypothetical protein
MWIVNAHVLALDESLINGFDLRNEPKCNMCPCAVSRVLNLCIHLACRFVVNIEPTIHRLYTARRMRAMA